MDHLAKVRYWLSMPGNTFPKLAVALDYESDQAIRMWFTRNQVPKRELDKLLSIIDKDIKESANVSSDR